MCSLNDANLQLVQYHKVFLHSVIQFEFPQLYNPFSDFSHFIFYCFTSSKFLYKKNFIVFSSLLKETIECYFMVNREIKNAFDDIEIECHHKLIHIKHVFSAHYVFMLRVKAFLYSHDKFVKFSRVRFTRYFFVDIMPSN